MDATCTVHVIMCSTFFGLQFCLPLPSNSFYMCMLLLIVLQDTVCVLFMNNSACYMYYCSEGLFCLKNLEADNLEIQADRLKQLMEEIPSCNKLLLGWLITHLSNISDNVSGTCTCTCIFTCTCNCIV